MEKVFIALATCNGASYLKPLLESVRRQSHSAWTLLARDDRSSEATAEILRRTAAEDRRIVLLEDDLGRLGPAANFGLLMRHALERGAEYLLFADQDDVWLPDKVDGQLRLMRDRQRVQGEHTPQLVYSDLRVVDAQTRTIHPSFLRAARLGHGEGRPLRTLLGRSFVLGCACLINRPLLQFALPVPPDVASHDWWVALCGAAVRPSYEALAAELPTQEQLSIDETATKEENGKAWLWTFVARWFTVFTVRATREATALVDLLKETFHGIVTCDRAKMYWYLGRLQWCWAHLKRDFQAMIDGGDRRAKHLGWRLRRATCELFEHWADYRAGRISRSALLHRMGPVRRKVECLLLRGTQSGSRDVRGTCRELYEHRQWLWTFLRHEGVEPTNNAGERSLRHAVIWRKLSFGTQSASGSRFVETMLTVIETCRQQGRNVFSFLTAAVEAHLAHQPAPLLLSRV